MASKKKITFRELYAQKRQEPTPQQAFVAEVAALTGCSPTTVKMWGIGYQAPEKYKQLQIAQHFGVDMDSLFPAEALRPNTRK